MGTVYDCSDREQMLAGMRAARQTIARGEVIVAPTDTVYGVAADAFSPAAVKRLLETKGRSRQQPPPVLVGSTDALHALVERFWPGGLTIVLPAQPSLTWDLGETKGTVAVRQPDHAIMLELLAETGPLAVSSANLTGQPAAIDAPSAVSMLGESVSVFLDDGPVATGVASTIIDATGLAGRGERIVRVLRDGAISRAELREVLGDLLEADPREDPPQ
jgi:tRNA threonylcarbamoyl adenosine modification protein (Sua5/YciO/YrdC/YwlC family)